MERKKIYLQIQNNKIILLSKDKLITKDLKKIVDNYKIINKEKFVQELNKLSKKEHINYLTSEINLIIDDIYNDTEKEILLESLKEISFNKITIIEPKKIMNQTINNILIRISNSNAIINYYNRTIFLTIPFNLHKEILLSTIKEIIKLLKIEKIKIYGETENISSISKYLENKLNIKTYIFSYPELMPLIQLKNTMEKN